jgi:hypothetical protein
MTHKCAECGYLTVIRMRDRSLIEASSDFRERGAVPNELDDKGGNQHSRHEVIPLCFDRQLYLRDAIKTIDKQNNQNDEVKAVINKENDCAKSIKWEQGFTPKEHREIMDRQAMLDW